MDTKTYKSKSVQNKAIHYKLLSIAESSDYEADYYIMSDKTVIATASKYTDAAVIVESLVYTEYEELYLVGKDGLFRHFVHVKEDS